MPCRSPAGSSSNGQQSSPIPSLSQEALPPELFDLLVLTLCRQAPAFATSLSYAKLVTAVLTMYQSHVSNAWRAGAVWCFLALGGGREAEGLSAGAAAEPGPTWPWALFFRASLPHSGKDTGLCWCDMALSSLLLSPPGHTSPPQPPGSCSGRQQCSPKEISAGCARSQVRSVSLPGLSGFPCFPFPRRSSDFSPFLLPGEH